MPVPWTAPHTPVVYRCRFSRVIAWVLFASGQSHREHRWRSIARDGHAELLPDGRAVRRLWGGPFDVKHTCPVWVSPSVVRLPRRRPDPRRASLWGRLAEPLSPVRGCFTRGCTHAHGPVTALRQVRMVSAAPTRPPVRSWPLSGPGGPASA